MNGPRITRSARRGTIDGPLRGLYPVKSSLTGPIQVGRADTREMQGIVGRAVAGLTPGLGFDACLQYGDVHLGEQFGCVRRLKLDAWTAQLTSTHLQRDPDRVPGPLVGFI